MPSEVPPATSVSVVAGRHDQERAAAWQVDDLPGMRHGLSPKRCAQTVDHRRQRRPGFDRFSVQYQH